MTEKVGKGWRWMGDTLVNLLSQIGSSKDKSTYSRYVYAPLARDQLEAAYRSDWIARKIVNIPAADATREWRNWQADNDEIEQIEAIERQFRYQQKVKRVMIMARLFGGAALVMGVDDGRDPKEPLEWERVGKDQLKFIHAVSRYSITAGPLEQDITSPWYLEPQWYDRRANQFGQMLRIHPSRVVQFVGNEVPDPESTFQADAWGDSILQAVDDAVRASGRVAGGIAAMIDELKLDVISIPGLTETVATQAGRDMITKRLSYANQAKSIVNALVLDADETWQRTELNTTGMPDLMREYFVLAAGAADIPVTRMLAQSPKGMNATGQSDTRNYYDMVASDQDTETGPRLERVDNVLIRSTFGADKPDIFYEWNPLWQMDKQEEAVIADHKAKVFAADVLAGVFPNFVLRDMRANQLIEDRTYPGLEGLMQEAEDLGLLSKEEPEDPALDPNVDPANENNPQPQPKKVVKAVVKAADAAGMIRRFRRRVRRLKLQSPAP